MRLWVGVVSILLWSSSNVFAHVDIVTRCFHLQHHAIHKLSEGEFADTGLFEEIYDRNGDNQPDISTLSVVHGNAHASRPLFFLVDSDLDGEPDILFIDAKGDGVCEYIVPYHSRGTGSLDNILSDMKQREVNQ